MPDIHQQQCNSSHVQSSRSQYSLVKAGQSGAKPIQEGELGVEYRHFVLSYDTDSTHTLDRARSEDRTTRRATGGSFLWMEPQQKINKVTHPPSFRVPVLGMLCWVWVLLLLLSSSVVPCWPVLFIRRADNSTYHS